MGKIKSVRYLGDWKMAASEKRQILELAQIPSPNADVFITRLQEEISTYRTLRADSEKLLIKRLRLIRRAATLLVDAMPTADDPPAAERGINHILLLCQESGAGDFVARYNSSQRRLKDLLGSLTNATEKAETMLKPLRGRPSNWNARFFANQVLKAYFVATANYPTLGRSSVGYRLLQKCLQLAKHELADPYNYYKFVLTRLDITDA